MSQLALVIGLLILLLVMSIGAFGLFYLMQRRARLAERLNAVRYREGASAVRTLPAPGIATLIAALGTGVARSGLLSPKTIAGLEQTLTATGLNGSRTLGLFVGAKLLLLLVMPLLALGVLQHLSWAPLIRNTTIAGAALLGLLAPDWWVRRRYSAYLRAIMAGLPDALDLMVICAEAGLGFEPRDVARGKRNPPRSPGDQQGIWPNRQRATGGDGQHGGAEQHGGADGP